MARNTGIVQRTHHDGFKEADPCDSDHMSAISCLGRRSAFHHRGFYTQAPDGTRGPWLEVWWTTDTHTGTVTDIFEDTRGLNRR